MRLTERHRRQDLPRVRGVRGGGFKAYSYCALDEQPWPCDAIAIDEARLEVLSEHGEIVHACPPDGSGIMPCCDRTPFEVMRDRITLNPILVTCHDAARAALETK